MNNLITHNPAETVKFGEEFARELSAGHIVAIEGELGSGKTVLTQGICYGLGYRGIVSSPSYVKIHSYPHTFTIYHVDFYLLRSVEDAVDLGLEELFFGNNIVIIEWAQRFPALIPENSWRISIEWVGKKETVRKIKIQHRA